MKNYNLLKDVREKLKEPFTYTVIAAFAILCSCFCITRNQFVIKETYSEKTERAGLSPVMDSGMIIHQEINVSGTIIELELQTDGISEGDKGSMEILLKHSAGSIRKSFSPEEIFNNGQKVLMKLTPGIVGPIDIYISEKDMINPVALKTRSEKLFGKYDINGTIQSGNLAIIIKTSVIPRYTYLRISLLIMMLTVFGYHIYAYRFPERKKEKAMYWIAVLYIFCTLCIRYPVSTLLAEPCWETLTNISHQTLLRGVQGSFFLDDSGYWPLFPRLIAFVVLLLFQQKKNMGIIYAVICLSTIVGLTAEFVKSKYDKFLFLEARFMIALLMGATCYLELSQMLLLHNIAYLGIFIVIWALMNDLESISPLKQGLLYFFTFLFTSSKPQYIGLIPLVFLMIVIKRKQLSIKKLRYCLVCCIGPFLQMLYLISGLAEDSYSGKRPWGLFHIVFETCYTYLQSFIYFFEDFNKNAINNGLFINISISLILFLLLLRLIFYHKNNRSLFCIALFFWGGGITFSNTITGRIAQATNKSYIFSVTSYTSGRAEFLVIAGILFFCILVVSNDFLVNYDQRWKRVILCVVLLLCVSRFSKNMHGNPEWEERTNWKQFAFMMEEPAYAIPVVQRDSFIIKNADVIYYGQNKLSESIVRQSSRVTEENQLQSIIFSSIEVGDAVKKNGIISIYTRKMYISQPKEVNILLLNENGEILAHAQGMAEYDRSIIGFHFKENIHNVSRIEFYCPQNGMPYELKPELFIAVAR